MNFWVPPEIPHPLKSTRCATASAASAVECDGGGGAFVQISSPINNSFTTAALPRHLVIIVPYSFQIPAFTRTTISPQFVPRGSGICSLFGFCWVMKSENTFRPRCSGVMTLVGLLFRKGYYYAINSTKFVGAVTTNLGISSSTRHVYGARYLCHTNRPFFGRFFGPNINGSLLKIEQFASSGSALPQDHYRCVHSGPEEQDNQTQLNKRLPPLTPLDPALIWPKFTNSIRNWFFTYFVIKPYFDKDFSMQEFMEGAHEAVSHVSSKLSAGEFDGLEGLVEPSLLSELKQRISNFSVSQQDLLRVATEDIFFSFPYQIGVIIPDSPDAAKYIEPDGQKPVQTRHVEITVVLHVLRGMAEVQRTSKDSSFSVIDFTKDEDNKYRVMVCNYRFFRDFTVGCKDPTWIINMVNHFLPAEIQR